MSNGLPSPDQILNEGNKLPSPNDVLGVKKKDSTGSYSQLLKKSTTSATVKTTTQKPSVSSGGKKTNKNVQMFTGFPGKEGKQYALDMSSGIPAWKEYSSSDVVNGKTVDKFEKVITDPNRVNQLNKYFKQTASTSNLEKIRTGLPTKEENQYRVKGDNWERLTEDSNQWEQVNDENAVNYLNKYYGESVKVTPKTLKDPEPKVNTTIINTDLISKTEEEVVPTLQRNFGKYGFTFTESGLGTDYVKVTSRDGVTKEFSLDERNPEEALRLKSFIEGNKVATRSAESQSILDLTREATRNDLGIEYRRQKSKELKDYRNSNQFVTDLKNMNFNEVESNINAIKKSYIFRKDKEGLEEFYNSPAYKIYRDKKNENTKSKSDKIDALYYELNQAKTADQRQIVKSKIDTYMSDQFINKQTDNYSIQLSDAKNSAKKLQAAARQYEMDLQEFNSRVESGNISQEEYESSLVSFERRAEYIDSRRSELNQENTRLVSDMKKLETVAGKYIINKEKTGSFGGMMINSTLNGLSKIFEPAVEAVVPFVADRKVLAIDPDKKRMLKNEKGYTDEQIENYVINESVKNVKQGLRQGLIEAFGSTGTTTEYMQSKDRGFIEKALVGVAESLPAMFTPGGAAARFSTLAAQAYSSIEDEMLNDKDFETSTALERSAIAVPYAMGMGALENLGVSVMLSKNPIAKSLITRSIVGAVSKVGGDATREVFENVLSKEIKSNMAKFGIRVVGGTLAEAETGALQSLALDIGWKGVANKIANAYDGKLAQELTDGEYFDTPDSFKEGAMQVLEDAAAEAIGGFVMTTVGTSAQGLINGRLSLYDEKDAEFLKSMTTDPEVKKMFIAKLKTDLLNGNITKSEAESQLQAVNEVSGIFNSTPENITGKDLNDSVQLIIERKALEKEIEGKDENLVAAQKARIADINNQLKTISEDAVQKQTAGEVPVQPEAAVSGEMAQGEPQAEPQVTAEEGQAVGQEEVVAQINIAPLFDTKVNTIQEAEAIRQSDMYKKYKTDMSQTAQKFRVNIDSIDDTIGGYAGTSEVSTILNVTGNWNDIIDFAAIYGAMAPEVQDSTIAGRIVTDNTPEHNADRYDVGIDNQDAALKAAQDAGFSDEGFTMSGNNIIFFNIFDYPIDNFDEKYATFVDKYIEYGGQINSESKSAVQSEFIDSNRRAEIIEKIEGNAIQQARWEGIRDAVQTAKERNRAYTLSRSQEQQDTTKQEVVDEAKINEEVDKLEKLLKDKDPNFQLDTELTDEQRKESLVSEALNTMSNTDINEMSEESFEAQFPSPEVKTYTIDVKENSKLASKLKKMGLKDLIGKKINLVMADQLKVGEVMGRKRMGGPFFPLIDELFGKVAWASMNQTAAQSIINGAVKSDYTVVYNMNPSAIDSNVAITETFEDLVQSLPKNKQKLIFSAIQEQVLKNKYTTKTDQVRAIAKSSKTLTEFFTELDKLDVDTISAVVKNIMPSRDVDAGTKIGKLLQDEGITIESIREMNVEQFASELPAGALTMVIEVTDKSGKKVTKETAKEAIITPEQQDAEGLPRHKNYPIYVRGKAVAMLSETVPFWNILKESINNINVKVAGIVREKSGRRLSSKEAVSNEMRSASMTASVAKKVSEKINTQYSRFVSAISQSFPNVEVVTSQEEFDNLLKDLSTKKLSTKNAKVYGAVYKGKLYLNPSLENYNTPIHEFGHLWINTAKVASKKLYDKGISLVKGSEYENKIRSSKAYQRVINQMKAEGASNADIDNYIYEEALATAVGDKGESFVTASQRLDFKNWMKKLFSFVKSMTGISQYTSEQLENITLDEFAQAVSIDIMSGTELFKGAESANLSDALQLMTNDSKSIEYIISTAKNNNISDAAIREYLKRKLEITDKEATEAINQYNIKEEDIWVPSKGKLASRVKSSIQSFRKRFLSARAFLPKSVFAYKEQKEASVASHLNIVDQNVTDFNRLYDKYKGNKEQLVKDFDAYIRGDKTVELQEEFKILANSMRNQIDGLSRQLIDLGLLDKDTKKNAKTKQKIEDNLGKYLTRSYKVYNNANWKNEVEEEVKQRALNFMRTQYKTMAEEIAIAENMPFEEALNNIVNNKFDELLNKEGATNFVKGSRLGSKDLSVLKERQDIPFEIRALMGEYEDPALNYANTVMKLSSLAANHKYLTEVRNAGMGKYFFEKNDPRRGREFNTQIATEKSETMNPLNGLYTTKEIAEAFESQQEELGTLMQNFMKLQSGIRWAKTIGSVGTHFKNVIGNLGFVWINAHYKDMGKAYKTVKEDLMPYGTYLGRGRRRVFGQKPKEANETARKMINNYIKLGIVKQSAGLGEIRDMFKDANFDTAMASRLSNQKLGLAGKAKRFFLQGKKKIEDTYQAEDDFFKIVAYENELSRYSKAMFGKSKSELTEQELDEVNKVVTEIVKNTYPTYDRIPEAVKMIRRFPFIGNFVSFQAEAYRTAFNTIALAKQEITSKDPDIRKIGATRLAGATSYLAAKTAVLQYVGMAAGTGLTGAFGYFFDDDDEEEKDKDIREFVAPWSKESDLLVIDAGNGKLKYIDFSATDPHGGIKKAINAFLLGESTTDSFIDGLIGVIQPFIGEEMTTEAILALKNNRDKYGKEIWNPEDNEFEKIKSISIEIYKLVEPGTISSIRRGVASEDKGQELVANLTGFRTYDVDINKQFGFKVKDYSERIKNAKRIYNSAFFKEESTKQEKEQAYKKANNALSKIYKEVISVYNSAERLGVKPDDLRNSMMEFGDMSRADIFKLQAGEVPELKSKEKNVVKTTTQKWFR